MTFDGGSWVDRLSARFSRLLKRLELNRPRIGFYTLRRVFRTIADETRDFPAIDLIMGHRDPTMGGHYRERISDERLTAVSDYVRNWLFGVRKPR